MDPHQIMLLLASKSGISLSMIALMVLMPHVNTIIRTIYINARNWINNIFYNKWNFLEFNGINCIMHGTRQYDYPKEYIAISYYAYTNNLCKDLKSIIGNIKQDLYNNSRVTSTSMLNYILNDCIDMDLNNGIFISVIQVHTNKKESGEKDKSDNIVNTISLRIKSKKHTTKELIAFVDKCVKDYDTYVDSKNKNKRFHFIFTGTDTDSNGRSQDIPRFTKNELLDINKKDNNESFEHLFNEHKETMIQEIKNIHNVSYYKQNGMKRKLGYLFYGHPGCGKTYTVSAMATLDNRHIIEIPLSRIAKNSTMEKILSMTEIQGVTLTKNTVIYLFDEIDTAGQAVGKRQKDSDDKDSKDNKETKEKEPEKEPSVTSKMDLLKTLLMSDKSSDPSALNMSTLLSRLDGVGNYDGVIYIATTNYKNKLDPALYRDGRLDLVYFDFSRKEDIKDIIEKYYEVTLTNAEYNSLPDRNDKIAPATIRRYIRKYSKYTDLIAELQKIALTNRV